MGSRVRVYFPRRSLKMETGLAQTGPYISVVVETYYQPPMAGYRGGIRVRPISGQEFPATMNVECPRAFRVEHPVGTRFRMNVRLTDRDGRGEFLMADFKQDYEVVR